MTKQEAVAALAEKVAAIEVSIKEARSFANNNSLSFDLSEFLDEDEEYNVASYFADREGWNTSNC